MKKMKWKNLKIEFDGITCPTLRDIQDLARTLVETGVAKKLSVPRFNLCCILANLILDEKTIDHPIFPKHKLKKVKEWTS